MSEPEHRVRHRTPATPARRKLRELYLVWSSMEGEAAVGQQGEEAAGRTAQFVKPEPGRAWVSVVTGWEKPIYVPREPTGVQLVAGEPRGQPARRKWNHS